MSRSRDLANLAGDATGLETLTVSDITDLTATATELNKLDGVTASTAELNHVGGVGSAIQTQINSKIGGSNPTITLGSNATFPGPPTGASGGHVLQVVSQTYSTYTSNNTGDWEDTGLTASITPSDSSNKVLVLVSQAFGLTDSNGDDSQQQVNLIITDGSNNILHGQSGYDQFRVKNIVVHLWQTNLMYLHHPNTESSFTYKTRFRKQAGTNTYVTAQYGSHPSTITLMEVVG